jgi:hypothetical protein
MDQLVSCQGCRHGALSHEAAGCTHPKCCCTRTLPYLIEEALEAARLEIRREWNVAS